MHVADWIAVLYERIAQIEDALRSSDAGTYNLTHALEGQRDRNDALSRAESKKLQQLREELGKAHAIMQRLYDEISNAQRTIGASDRNMIQAKQQITTLTSQLEKARKELPAQRNKIERLFALVETKSALISKRQKEAREDQADDSEMLSNVYAVIQQMHARIAELTEEAKQIPALTKERDALLIGLRDLSDGWNNMSSRYRAAFSALDAQEARQQRLDAANGRLKTANRLLTGQNSELTKSAEEHTKQMQALKSEAGVIKAQLQDANDQAKAESERHKKAIGENAKQITWLENELKTAREKSSTAAKDSSDLQTLETQISTLENNLKNAQDEAGQLTKTLEKSQKQATKHADELRRKHAKALTDTLEKLAELGKPLDLTIDTSATQNSQSWDKQPPTDGDLQVIEDALLQGLQLLGDALQRANPQDSQTTTESTQAPQGALGEAEQQRDAALAEVATLKAANERLREQLDPEERAKRARNLEGAPGGVIVPDVPPAKESVDPDALTELQAQVGQLQFELALRDVAADGTNPERVIQAMQEVCRYVALPRSVKPLQQTPSTKEMAAAVAMAGLLLLDPDVPEEQKQQVHDACVRIATSAATAQSGLSAEQQASIAARTSRLQGQIMQGQLETLKECMQDILGDNWEQYLHNPQMRAEACKALNKRGGLSRIFWR